MATAIGTTTEKVVEVKGVQLTLSMPEARCILALLAHVGGDDQRSYNKHAWAVYNALHAKVDDPDEADDFLDGGSLKFLDGGMI